MPGPGGWRTVAGRGFAANGAPRGLTFAAVVLNMVPADVQAFATSHQDVGGRVLADSTVDASIAPALGSALGPAGAAFVTAIEQFSAQLHAAGSRLSADYGQLGDALSSGADAIVSTDTSSGAGFTAPSVIET